MVKTTWLGLIKSEKAKNPGKSLGEIMKIASPKWKKMKKGGGDGDPVTPTAEPAVAAPVSGVVETPDSNSVADVPGDSEPAVPSTGGRRKSKKSKGGKKRCKSKRRASRRKK
jgi:hypothetical protein